jgi:hypothetical protein
MTEPTEAGAPGSRTSRPPEDDQVPEQPATEVLGDTDVVSPKDDQAAAAQPSKSLAADEGLIDTTSVSITDDPATCPTCGRPMPVKDALPASRHIVDLTEQLGTRRIHLPDADLGDYTGTITIPLSPVYSIRVNKVNVWPTKWNDPTTVWLDHDDLVRLCQTTVTPPPQAAPVIVSLSKKRAQKPVAARTQQPEGEPA